MTVLNRSLFLLLVCLVANIFAAAGQRHNSSDTTSVTSHRCARVVEPAVFPQGSWECFFENHFNNNVAELNGAPVGIHTVIIFLIIDRDGVLRQANVGPKLKYGMEEEVLRVISLSPRWLPRKENGRKVNDYRRQVVTFEVVKPGKFITTCSGRTAPIVSSVIGYFL